MTDNKTNQNNPNEESLVVDGRKLSIEEYLDHDEKKDLLRLLTAGSVDDGKSTLIGRLLFDSKTLRRPTRLSSATQSAWATPVRAK